MAAETAKTNFIMDELKKKQRELKGRFVGKKLSEVPTPSVVLDLKQVTVNCERMLEAADNIGLQWRAHIKTHKVTDKSSGSQPRHEDGKDG